MTTSTPPNARQGDDPLEPASTLFGGEELAVTLHNGASSTVFVRAVPYGDLGQVYQAMVNWSPRKLLLLYTGKSQPWVDSLTDDSAEAILRKGHELNFPRMERWIAQEKDALGAIAPMLENQLKHRAAHLQKLQGEVSPPPPRTSPSPPDGPAPRSSASPSPG